MCRHAVVPGCVACATAAACNHGDACTSDLCNANGACEYQRVTDCTHCTAAAQ